MARQPRGTGSITDRRAQGDLAPGLSPVKVVSASLGARATILTAAKGDEYARPLSDGRRPAFSYLVLGALRGWGDLDGDGTVTASESVQCANDALFQTVTGRLQTPTLQGPEVTLSLGREAGPDLVDLAVAAAREVPSPVKIIDSDNPDALTAGDIQAMLAARKQREAGEAREQALLDKLRRERKSTLSGLAARKQAEAQDLWGQMKPLLDGGGPEAEKATRAFVEQYRSVEVVVEDVEGRHSRAVAIPEVAEATLALPPIEQQSGDQPRQDATRPPLDVTDLQTRAASEMRAGNCLRAVQILSACKDVPCWRDVASISVEAQDCHVYAERERAGIIYLQALRQAEPSRRIVGLQDALAILNSLRTDYPDSRYFGALQRDIELIGHELSAERSSIQVRTDFNEEIGASVHEAK